MEWFPVITGLAGIIIALTAYSLLARYDDGSISLQNLSALIRRGALVFLRREYTLLIAFILIVAIAVFIFLGTNTLIAYFVGAGASALAGFVGMLSATKANVKTTHAAQSRNTARALWIAFHGGSVMGLAVASFGLLGLGLLFVFFGAHPAEQHALHGFGMGASIVALFSRVGGGIFTKCADMGADLVGKVEAGIPEDDPRNPAVIADNVGDNVGDVAGMGSDLFESYCGAMIATIAIASTTPMLVSDSLNTMSYTLLPLVLSAVGLLSSLLGMVVVRFSSQLRPAIALRLGTLVAAVSFLVAAMVTVDLFHFDSRIGICIVAGIGVGVLIGWWTEYMTSGRPAQKIAEMANTGPAVVIIQGIALGMRSTVVPLIALAAIILFASSLMGLYGVAIAAVGMLATVGMIMAIDAYGPIADNAGGIAEMAGLGEETRRITDELDTLGNTTAAIGKGFAIAAATLAAMAIIAAYVSIIKASYPTTVLDLNSSQVLVGVLIGGVIPFLIASNTMTSVGEAAFEMIEEVRRQFTEHPEILQGTVQPDHDRCITIATNSALSKMIFPAVVAISIPPLVGFAFGPETLGGVLAGSLVSCVLLALTFANAGGAWDNAKKMLEKKGDDAKGTESHKACVIGDTVGDPFKDTSGPSMNILINVMAIVSLVIAPLL